jgi:hypothetical protein
MINFNNVFFYGKNDKSFGNSAAAKNLRLASNLLTVPAAAAAASAAGAYFKKNISRKRKIISSILCSGFHN